MLTKQIEASRGPNSMASSLDGGRRDGEQVTITRLGRETGCQFGGSENGSEVRVNRARGRLHGSGTYPRGAPGEASITLEPTTANPGTQDASRSLMWRTAGMSAGAHSRMCFGPWRRPLLSESVAGGERRVTGVACGAYPPVL